MTDPAAVPVRVTAHRPFTKAHEDEEKETDPAPVWVHATVPPGRYPVTTAVHLMAVGDPATAEVGPQ